MGRPGADVGSIAAQRNEKGMTAGPPSPWRKGHLFYFISFTPDGSKYLVSHSRHRSAALDQIRHSGKNAAFCIHLQRETASFVILLLFRRVNLSRRSDIKSHSELHESVLLQKNNPPPKKPRQVWSRRRIWSRASLTLQLRTEEAERQDICCCTV